MRTFTENSIRSIDLDWGSKHRFYFECAMVSTCSPVFNRCSDNYDVERELRNANVLRKNNTTDTETCALMVLFSNKKSALNFINRLNKYLATKGA
mgnify:CR=1 FL=1